MNNTELVGQYKTIKKAKDTGDLQEPLASKKSSKRQKDDEYLPQKTMTPLKKGKTK